MEFAGYFTDGPGSELEDIEFNSDVTNAMTKINWSGSNGMKVVSVKWEADNLVASIS